MTNQSTIKTIEITNHARTPEEVADGMSMQDCLMGFAAAYSRLSIDAKMSEDEQAAVREQYEYLDRVMARPNLYLRKRARKVAQRHDTNFRLEARLAQAIVNGDDWEKQLVKKAPYLYLAVASVIEKQAMIEEAVADPDSEVEPVLGYFRMKTAAAEKALKHAMVVTFTAGEACIARYEGIKKDLSAVWKDYTDITDLGVMPSRVAAWKNESEKVKPPAPAEQAAA